MGKDPLRLMCPKACLHRIEDYKQSMRIKLNGPKSPEKRLCLHIPASFFLKCETFCWKENPFLFPLKLYLECRMYLYGNFLEVGVELEDSVKLA